MLARPLNNLSTEQPLQTFCTATTPQLHSLRTASTQPLHSPYTTSKHLYTACPANRLCTASAQPLPDLHRAAKKPYNAFAQLLHSLCTGAPPPPIILYAVCKEPPHSHGRTATYLPHSLYTRHSTGFDEGGGSGMCTKLVNNGAGAGGHTHCAVNCVNFCKLHGEWSTFL